jgi:transcriptional regulator with XRE-family HTH domain
MGKRKSAKSATTKKVPGKSLVRLATRIRDLRIKKGYQSHEIFAYDHGFNRSQWGRYERGEDLRYSSLERVAAAFDMSLEEFFSEGFD